MTEGTRGGDKRPGSAPAEIDKLPTSRCRECGLIAVRAIVVDGKCVNTAACKVRRKRNVRRSS